MKIALVGCCYIKDIYSQNFALLARIAGGHGANQTRIITSNCTCFAHSRWFKIDESELLLPEVPQSSLAIRASEAEQKAWDIAVRGYTMP